MDSFLLLRGLRTFRSNELIFAPSGIAYLSVKWIDFCSFGDCVWVLSVADASLPDPLDPHVLVILVVLVVQLSQARLGVGLAHCTEKGKRVRGKEGDCGGGREGKRKEEGVRVCACLCV